jgi:hypothetical protein
VAAQRAVGMTLRDPTHPGPDHKWYEHRRSALSAGSDWLERHRSAAFILIRVHALEINTPQDFTRDSRWRIDFGNYSPEFDQAIRLKPSLTFHINKNSRFTPAISGEWFYSLANKDLGKRFTKYRLALGTSYNLKGPKSLDVKYVFGRNINLAKNEKEHIFSLTYNYDWEKLTPEEKAKRAKAKAKKKLKRIF